MPRQFRPRRDLNLDRMFETRSDAWEAVGLSFEVNRRAVKRAQRQALVLLPLLIALDVFFNIAYSHPPRHRSDIERWGLGSFQIEIKVAGAILALALGWALARAIGRFVGPTFMRRMDPGTAGTFGFLLRLVTMLAALLLALNVGRVDLQTVAVGGAFTAVVVGLAAQQTLGNMIAGMVLLSARPFRVGERVQLQAGALGGRVEGIVSSLGLLYTTLARGADRIMVPNNVVLAAVVVPVKEPESVDVKVRLTSGVRPSQVQAILDQEVATPTRNGTSVLLEEVDGSDVVVRVQAAPERSHDGAKLADEIMLALSSVTGEHEANGAASNAGGHRDGDEDDRPVRRRDRS
ncbi:MAG: mechanosensitive ion channel domain-containing protein [Solirubrobacteraceae bacterium]